MGFSGPIAVVLAGLATASAQAACPTTLTAGAAFALTEADGRTRFTVRALPDERVSTERFYDDKPVQTVIYDRGLFPAKAINGSVVTTYEYSGRIDGFRLQPGDRTDYVVVSRTPARADFVSKVEMSVTGTEEITIGACRYAVVVVERVNSYSNGSSNIVLAFFSPELKVPLRTRIRWAKGEQSDHEFRSIETIDD